MFKLYNSNTVICKCNTNSIININNINNNSNNIRLYLILSYGIQTLLDKLCMAYKYILMIMLILMTLTLMQGHSGLAKEQIQRWIILYTILQSK